jgi:uncharacterized protein YdiU (UPF0061 family)
MVSENDTVGWRFENTYSRLPEAFFSPAHPAAVRAPKITILNHNLAGELGLCFHVMAPEAQAALFTGQALPAGSQPIAQAYAGHQFGGFTMLGDGRAILLGEHRTPSGTLVDIQFKGSGPTRYSRNGDGRAAIGPMLREYIISEAMAALGIPTTRSLAVATTGETVYRERPLKGAVLTRVAASHIRVGTFQYLAARKDEANLRVLSDYAIARHYPELTHAPRKYLDFFRAVSDRQASLIARWQLAGFVHGVMNTDNMAISGETIDYGPCAFMDAYDPKTVFSSIDHDGRYAYGNQPYIAQWNLVRFAETLLPLIDADQDKAIARAKEVIEDFPAVYEGHWLAGMRKKLGLGSAEDGDKELVQSLRDWMEKSNADFTNTFRDLSADALPHADRYEDAEFRAWHTRWQDRLSREGRSPAAVSADMRSVNPAVIPRNHRVEDALAAASDRDDLEPLGELLAVLASPFELSPGMSRYAEPQPAGCGYRTFCGT